MPDTLEDLPRITTVGSETGSVEPTVAPHAEHPKPVATRAPAVGGGANLAALAVASALMMEFIDSTALSTALPTLARGFHSDPVHLKLALTSYLLALAVFTPGSGWVADRFGARRVFVAAMLVFMAGSFACGFSGTLGQLVAARILQGAGGAMMTPVGRLIVVGSAPRERLVSAMGWFTTPALVGPLIGPPVAGFILSVASWRWIFFINIPVCVIGIAAVLAFVPRIRQPHPGRFDVPGFVLSALAISALVVLAETAGVGLLPPLLQSALALAALALGWLFVRHALRAERPVLNLRLLSQRTFRASLVGGTLVRLGIGATPFLLPLLLQVGLGWSPLRASLVTIFTAVGALTAKFLVQPVIRRFGFRTTLLCSALGVGVVSALPGLFSTSTPAWVMVAVMAGGGLVRSTQFTSANTVAYADIPREQVSQASTLSTVTQQLGLSLGVSFGAMTLHIARGGANGPLTPDRFLIPFMLVGFSALLALPIYWRLNPDVGADISGRREADA